VLRFRYSFGNEREVNDLPLFQSSTTLKGIRYSTALDFNVHPDVRMTVSNTVSHLLTSSGFVGQHRDEAFALETRARLKFQLARWFDLTVGAGEGSTGGAFSGGDAPRRHHFLYEVKPSISRNDWRFEFGSQRGVGDITPLSVHNNVTTIRSFASASYFWRKRVRFSAGWWREDFSVDCPPVSCRRNDPLSGAVVPTLSSYDTFNNGAEARVVVAVIRGERVTLDLGAESSIYVFDLESGQQLRQDLGSAGFFMPRQRVDITPLARFSWDPHSMVNWLLEGSGGWKRNLRFPDPLLPPGSCDFRGDCWGPTARFATQLTLHRNRWEWFVRYGFSHSDSGSALSENVTTGNYRVHSASTGLTYRF
jgi:hypothetical protein